MLPKDTQYQRRHRGKVRAKRQIKRRKERALDTDKRLHEQKTQQNKGNFQVMRDYLTDEDLTLYR